MINKNIFLIDFKKKQIKLNFKYRGDKYSVQEFYSDIQDVFDDPENMKYDIPIIAKSSTKFNLINGWKISNKLLKHLTGGTISLKN